MLMEELGLNLEILGNPLSGVLVMFGSFLLGGILPILPYFVVKFGLMSSGTSIVIAFLIKYCFIFHS
jgi:vacuolar iron transporter family protein